MMHNNRKNMECNELISVLVVLPWLQIGGSEILILDILNGLKENYSFTLLTSLADNHLLLKHFATAADKIFHFPGQHTDQHADEFYKFMRGIIKDCQPEIILSTNSKHFYYSLPALRAEHPNLIILDLLHNDSILGYTSTAIAHTQFINHHLCVNERIKKMLLKHNVNQKKISVMNNGINQKDMFYPHNVDRSIVKLKWDLPLNRPIIGFVGRMSPEKRPFLFLDLLKQLQPSTQAFGLLLGEGPLLNDVTDYVNKLSIKEHVHHIANASRESLWEIYEACDVVVNVSSVEGMPLTLLEALATGCPVAAMSVGQLESVIIDGENGILVEEDDAVQLALRLNNLLTNKTELANMRKKAVTHFNNSIFSLEKMLERYQSLFASYLPERFET